MSTAPVTPAEGSGLAPRQNAASPEETPKSIASKFNRLVMRARSVLLTERALPKVIAPLTVAGGFLAASWVGLWHVLPLEAKIIGVVAFAAATVAVPFLVRSGSLWITRKDAAKRIDEVSGDHTRPARTLADRINTVAPDQDPGAKAVWDLHTARIWNNWGQNFKTGKPKPDLNRYDPLRMRYIVPVCVALSAVAAGDQRGPNLAAAFDWTRPPPPPITLDVRAWVTPPANIDATPVYLREGTGADLAVHKQSILTVVVSGGNTHVTINGQDVPLTRTIRTRGQEETSAQYEAVLGEGPVTVQIENGPTWTFNVAPDTGPRVNIEGVEQRVPQNGTEPVIALTCSANDDYGLREGEIIIRVPPQNPTGAEADQPVPLGSSALPSVRLPRHRLCAQ